MPQPATKDGPKLTVPQKNMVRSLIVAGRNNAEINQALTQIDAPTLGLGALNDYRNSPSVQKLIVAASALMSDEGLNTRIKIHNHLSMHYRELQQDLDEARAREEDDEAGWTLKDKLMTIKALHAECVATLAQMDKMHITTADRQSMRLDKDGVTITSESITPGIGGLQGSPVSDQARYNDIREAALRRKLAKPIEQDLAERGIPARQHLIEAARVVDIVANAECQEE